MPILFRIIKKPSSYAFGDNMTHPPPPGERCVTHEIFPLFTNSIMLFESIQIFFVVKGEFSDRGIFHENNFPWGGKFPSVNFQRETLHSGNLPKFI